VDKKPVIAKTAAGTRSAKMQTMLSIAFGPVIKRKNSFFNKILFGIYFIGRSNLYG